MITFLNLKNHLMNNDYYSALCLCGNDRWLKRKSVSVICDAYGIANDEFGVEWLENPTYKEIETACCTFSMFCPKKLVVAEEFVMPQGKQQQVAVEKLCRLVAQCDGSFCLVFFAETPSGFDKVTGMNIVNCDKLDNESVAKWIIAYAKRQGVAISPVCARKIGEYCLQDMSRVVQETQKLLDFGEISLETVEQMVHKDAEYVVYNLSAVISNKNASVALEMYNGLIASGEEARALFGLLYNTYRRAYYVKTSNLETAQLGELLAVKPFAVEKSRELANKYKPMQLKRILTCFENADAKLKAFLDETDVMTTLILQIISI